jgi:hypothetical protein
MVILGATIPIGKHAMVAPRSNAVSRSWLGLIAAGLIWSAGSSPARAFDSWTVGLNGYQPRKEDAAYYKAHARPVLGEVRDIGNGSWLVETDLNTGLGEPRLVRLSNGRSITRANEALEAVHGRILQLERARRPRARSERRSRRDTEHADRHVFLSDHAQLRRARRTTDRRHDAPSHRSRYDPRHRARHRLDRHALPPQRAVFQARKPARADSR